MLGHLIIEPHGGGVSVVRLPVHTRRSLGSRANTNSLNETPTDAMSAQLWRGEEVLQVACLRRYCRASVKNNVRQPDERTARFCDERVHRFIWIKKALPCQPSRVYREVSRAGAAIEGIVSVPQQLPAGEVTGFNVSNDERLGRLHGSYQKTPAESFPRIGGLSRTS